MDNFANVIETQAQLIREVVTERDRLRIEVDSLRLERDHMRRCVEWYASSEQWTRHTDDRGREDFTFAFGEDGGYVARQCLRRWGTLEGPATASGPVGASVPGAAGLALGEAGPDA